MGSLHWLAAFVLAVALHLGVGLSLLGAEESGAASALGEGENGVEIGLGLEGSYLDLAEQNKVEPPPAESEPEVIEPEPVPPEPEVTESLALETVPDTAPELIDTPAADVVAVKAPEPEPAKPEPSKAEPRTETKAEQRPPQSKPRTEDKAQSVAMRRATGTGTTGRTAGGIKGNSQSYIGLLNAWINRNKIYPAELKKKKQEGVVVLKVMVSQLGNVHSAAVHKSSGYPKLDQAALEMLDKAGDLPPIPDSVMKGRDQFKLVIPIEYSLITD